MQKFSGVEEAKEIRNKLTEEYERLSRLKRIKEEITQASQLIKKKKVLLNKLPTSKEEKDLKAQLAVKLNKLEKLKTLKKERINLAARIKKKKDKVLENKKRVRSLVEEYSQLLKDAERCPTCFSEIDDQLIDGLINKYKEE